MSRAVRLKCAVQQITVSGDKRNHSTVYEDPATIRMEDNLP